MTTTKKKKKKRLRLPSTSEALDIEQQLYNYLKPFLKPDIKPEDLDLIWNIDLAIWDKLNRLLKTGEWQPKDISANEEWKVQKGKICEVYAFLNPQISPLVLNGTAYLVSMANINYNIFAWFPATISFGTDPQTNVLGYFVCTSPHGWTLTEGMTLSSAQDWVLLYRERKDLGSK